MVLPPTSYMSLNKLPNLPGPHPPYIKHGDITYCMGLLYLPCKVIIYNNVYKVIHICEVNKCMLKQYLVSAQ